MPPAPRATPLSSAPGALFGAILIGGESRRMGRAKHLLPWRGEALVERTARRLDAIVPEVVLVGAGELPESLASRERLEDVRELHGPVAGIVAALQSRPASAALVVACDQPLLSDSLLRWLVEQRAPGIAAIQPRAGTARIEPFPGIYEPASLEPLRRLGSEIGAAASLQRLGAFARIATPTVPAGLLSGLRGANTPMEIAELVALEANAERAPAGGSR